MPRRFPGDLVSNFDPRILDARRLRNIIRSSPACFNTLRCFIFRTISPSKPRVRMDFLMVTSISEPNSEPSALFLQISRKTVISFISSCKQLKIMGDLFSFWLEITQVKEIKQKLERRNLDVYIIYKKRHEIITMDTLTGEL